VIALGDQVVFDLMQVLLGCDCTLHFIRKINLAIPRLSVGIQGPVDLHFRWLKLDLSIRSLSLPNW
jgi:hypothetical protein